MTANQWLNHLASIVASRIARSRTHLASFAPSLAKDVPSRFLTEAVAEAVARDLGGLPSYADLRDLVRRHGNALPVAQGEVASDNDPYSREAVWIRLFDQRVAAGTVTKDYLGVVKAHGGQECWAHVLKRHNHLVRELRPDWLENPEDDVVEDKNWWRAWLTALSGDAPTTRWVRCMGTLAQVSQRGSVPRPWLIASLERIIARAEAEGADTSKPVASPVPPWIKGPAKTALRAVPGLQTDFAA